jgi:uncharacterized membrane protein
MQFTAGIHYKNTMNKFSVIKLAHLNQEHVLRISRTILTASEIYPKMDFLEQISRKTISCLWPPFRYVATMCRLLAR